MTFTAIATAAAAMLAIAYGAGQFMSRQIATEITIDAPASVVWQTLVETDSYADWNPFIRKLNGTLVQGERLAATIAPEGKSPMDFSPQVLVADENRELRWVGRLVLPGLFDGEHYFVLEEAGGKTTFAMARRSGACWSIRCWR